MKTDVHMSEKLSPKFVLRQKKILLVRGKTVGSSEYSSRSASAMWFVLIQRYENSLVLSDEPNTQIRISWYITIPAQNRGEDGLRCLNRPQKYNKNALF